MLRRTNGGIASRWASAAALLALLLAGAAPARAARDLVGLTQARFTWSAASGPVAGYRVYVERNYGQWVPHPSTPSAPADDRSVVIDGNYGDVYRVQVTAIADDGREGPRSNPSEYIQFKSATNPWGSPPPWTPPPTPPPWTPTPAPGPGSGSGSQAPQGSTPDFDGDGSADLLLREGGGSLMTWIMSGDGPKDTMRPGVLPLTSAIVGNGDYDGDGQADLLTRDDETGAITQQLLVDGAVVGGGTVASALSSDWALSGSGDFDGNGRDDILIRNTGTRKLEIWFMNGPSIVSRATLNDPFSSSWQVVGVADVSRDKLADIFWYNDATNTAQVSLFGSWRQIDKNLELFRSSTPGDVVAIGDADGNGLPDLVVAQESGELRIWLTTSDWSGPRATTSLSLDAAGLQVQACGDFDGDQRMDLLMRNPQTQDLRIWYLDGASVEDEVLLTDPGANWVFEGVGLESPATHR